jgi:hypothetical protein
MRRCSDIFLKELKKITEAIKFAGLRSETLTRELPDIKQVLYLKSRKEVLPDDH